MFFCDRKPIWSIHPDCSARLIRINRSMGIQTKLANSQVTIRLGA